MMASYRNKPKFAVRSAILPGYALLADLQNTIAPQQQQAPTSPTNKYRQPLNATSSGRSTPSYGSARKPDAVVGFDESQIEPSSLLPQRNPQQQQQQISPSSSTQIAKDETTAPGASLNSNLAQLDNLLDDLGCGNFGAKLETCVNNLCNSIMDPAAGHSAGGNRQVMFVKKETKTERMMSGSGGHAADESNKSATTTSSTITKDLDALMASLSDIKVSASSSGNDESDEYETSRQQKRQQQAVPNSKIVNYPRPIATQIRHCYDNDTFVDQYSKDNQLECMLGNLKAEMSRQGINTSQKGCCNACEKPIVGQVITALGKTWHPEHFTCKHCTQELGTRNFFERDGYPYCETDYHNLFSPRCAYCNGPILDKCVTALDKTWHMEHFFCAQCGKQFGDDGFHEKDGKPYCRDDYFDLFAPKCGACNRAITENYISALNAQWHADCFVCRDCHLPFQGGSFFDHDGQPYCETHYHAKRGSLCAGCHKPITGRCITAMCQKFHPEHFTCAFCLKRLIKGTFRVKNQKPYCDHCYDKLFGL